MTETSVSDYEALKLYGVAIAAIPESDGCTITVHCNSISASYGHRAYHRKAFDKLKNHSFSRSFDKGNEREIIHCCAELAGVTEQLIGIQKEALAEHGKPYIPAPIVMGQSLEKPIMSFASGPVCSLLFGERLPFNYESYLSFIEKSVDETGSHPTPEAVSEIITTAIKDSENYEIIRDGILQETGDLYSLLQKTCDSLARVFAQSTLYLGCYNVVDHLNRPLRGAKSDPTAWLNETPKSLDIKVAALREPFEAGDADARNQLIELARRRGVLCACKTWETTLTFGPSNYLDMPEGRKKFPWEGCDFLTWDREFESVFWTAFEHLHRISKRKYNNRVKLPIERQNPFFTDIVYNRLLDLFEVFDGQRKPENLLDRRQAREALLAASQKVSTSLRVHSEPTRNLRAGQRLPAKKVLE